MPRVPLGTRKYDHFFAAHSATRVQQKRAAPTVGGGGFTVTGQPQTITLSATADLQVGAIGFVAAIGAYFRVLSILSGTQIITWPVLTERTSGGDYAAIGQAVPAGSTFTVDENSPTVALELACDLRDAAESEVYSYLLLVSASLTAAVGNGAQMRAQVRVSGLWDDPYSSRLGAASRVRTPASFTVQTANAEHWFPYSSACVVGIDPGDVWIHRLEIAALTAGSTVEAHDAAMMAIRVNRSHPKYVEGGSGASGSVGVVSNSAVAWTVDTESQITVPASVVAGDKFLLVTSGLVGNNNATRANRKAEVRLDISGTGAVFPGNGTVLAEGTTDDVSVGYVQVVTGLAAGATIQWSVRAPSGNTAKFRSGFIALIPFDAIYGAADLFADYQGAGASGAAIDFTIGAQSGYMLVAEDTPTLEIIAARGSGAGGDLHHQLRPHFTGFNNRYYDQITCPTGIFGRPGTGTCHQLGFWLSSALRPKTEADALGVRNRVNTRIMGTGTSALADQASFTVVQLRGQISPLVESVGEDSAVIGILDVGRVYKLWTGAGTDLFAKIVGKPITEVRRNEVVMARVATLGALVADAWYVDPATYTVTIKMPAGKTPADIDQSVVVICPEYFSRESGDALIDDYTGVLQSFDVRIKELPSMQRRLDIRKDSIKTSAGFGSLELLTNDDATQKLLNGTFLKGLSARIYRGYRSAAKYLSDLTQLFIAVMDKPKPNPADGSITIDLSTTAHWLNRPVNQTQIDVYQGATQVHGFLLPTIYGYAGYVDAKRTTNNTAHANTNVYKICGHAITSVLGVRNMEASEGIVAPADYTADLNAATVTIANNKLISDVGNWTGTPPDAIKVRVLGKPLLPYSWMPSAIAYDLVVTVGKLAAVQFDKFAWRRLDRAWRTAYFAANGSMRRPISVGLYLSGSVTVEQALDRLAYECFAYKHLRRASGIVSAGVPDHYAMGHALNPGADMGIVYPWFTRQLATTALTTTKVVEGAYAIVVTSGGWGSNAQRVTLTRPGWWVVSALVALQSGQALGARLAITLPGDGFIRNYSQPLQISNVQFARLSMAVYVEPGQIGTALIEAIPYEPLNLEPAAMLIPGLACDICADDLKATLTDGASVAAWNDRSGNNNNFAQVTGTRQPTFRLDCFAGHAGVVFDQSGDSMTGTLSIAAAPLSIYLVYRSECDSSARRVVSGSNTNWFMGCRGAPLVYDAEVNGVVGVSPAATTGRMIVHTMIQTSSSLSEAWVNGTSVGQKITAGQQFPNRIDLGLNSQPPGATLFRVIIATAAHTTAVRQAIEAELMRVYGIANTSIIVDSCDVTPVAGVVDPEWLGMTDLVPGRAINARVQKIDSLPDYAYEAAVPFSVDLSDTTARAREVVVTEAMARGLTASYEPDKSLTKAMLQSAGRIDLGANPGDVLIDGDNDDMAFDAALGVAAPIALYYSRIQNLVTLVVEAMLLEPELGDMLYIPGAKFMPKQPLLDPLWKILAVRENDIMGSYLLDVAQPVNPVTDLGQLASMGFPMGALAISIDGGAITGWDEVIAARGKYLLASPTPDLMTERGAVYHNHPLLHNHVLASHYHEYTPVSVGASEPDGVDDAGRFTTKEFTSGDPFGPRVDVSRGASDGDHPHGPATGAAPPFNSLARADLVSNDPSVAMTSRDGPTDVKNFRVTLRRRTGGTDIIPTTIFVGWLSTTLPPGWTRTVWLNGYALKIADPMRAGAARTIAGAAFIPAVGGGNQSLTLDALDSVAYGGFLQITGGGHTNWVVVTAMPASGNTVTVRCLWLTGDAAAGTNYAIGTTVNPMDETSFTNWAGATHDHGGYIPAHQHRTPHDHFEVYDSANPALGATEKTTTGADPTDDQSVTAQADQGASESQHDHRWRPKLLPDDSLSSSNAGSITGAVDNTVPLFPIVWIRPTNADQTELPPGCIILTDGGVPDGCSPFGFADGYILSGAAPGAGSPGAIGASPHTHAAQFTAHTLAHLHNDGTYTLGDYSGTMVLFLPPGGGVKVAGGALSTDTSHMIGGHRHRVVLGAISQPKPNNALLLVLNSTTKPTSAQMPRYCQIRLVQKN